MKTRLLIAALVAGALLVPFGVAQETSDEEEDQLIPQGCLPTNEVCLIPCWPMSVYETGDLIPPVWFQIDWLCLPP